ncbi:MAG TPA: hypothetical protein VEP46_09290, partial [Vicinamibacterales bacterium]|nr:hypothetical protein [Vicinamibacterales bacterium]
MLFTAVVQQPIASLLRAEYGVLLSDFPMYSNVYFSTRTEMEGDCDSQPRRRRHSSEEPMMQRFRAPFVTALILLLGSVAVFTQGARWAKAAPFPEPDEELYGISVNGKIFVLGGFGTVRGKNY